MGKVLTAVASFAAIVAPGLARRPSHLLTLRERQAPSTPER